MFYVHVTHILFSSFAFLPSFPALCMSHFGAETGNIVEALLGVPLLPTLLASKAEFLVLVLSLGIGAAKITVKILVFSHLDIYDCSVQSWHATTHPFLLDTFLGPWEESLPAFLSPSKKSSLSVIPGVGGEIRHLKSQFENILTNTYFA